MVLSFLQSFELSVLQNILDEVDIKVRGPDEVPFESRHRALYHFLCKVDMAKCGVDPAQAWNDYGRLTLAERQLDLARRARVIHLKKHI